MSLQDSDHHFFYLGVVDQARWARPGAIFFNLEDETGLLNVVVLPEIWKEHRKAARRNPGLIIEGLLEYRDGVTNLVARGFVPLRTDPLQACNFR